MVQRANVLVVDDDQHIISAFEDFFKRERCHMLAASSAAEALKKIKQKKIDLLITDIRLSHESGVTFFLRLRAMGTDIPVIVITGYSQSIDVKELQALGADFVLVKPLELDRLREAVRACLSKVHRS